MALPEWGTLNPTKAREVKEGEPETKTQTQNGTDYNVTSTKYSITSTPTDIVTYAPVDGFWLGALVQQKGLVAGLGSIQDISIPAEKRAPFVISIDLNTTKNRVTVKDPSSSEVRAAIGELVQTNNEGNNARNFTTRVVDSSSEKQAALDLGLEVGYLSNEVKAALKTSSELKSRSVTVALVEKAFTVSTDFAGREPHLAFFTDKFSLADAKRLTEQQKVTMTNLPTYVNSVTYGRVVLINIISSFTREEVDAALKGKASGFGVSVAGNVDANKKSSDSSFNMEVTTFGGPASGAAKLVPASDIEDVKKTVNSYLQESAPLSTMVPIAYTVNSVRDGARASIARTTEFTVNKVVPEPTGIRYRADIRLEITGADDGFRDNTMECYGDMRVNGAEVWKIGRDLADNNQRERGGYFDISSPTNNKLEFEYKYKAPTQFVINLKALDKDSGSGDDVFADVNQTIDIGGLVKDGNLGAGQSREFSFPYDSGGGESSTLKITLTGLGPIG